MKKDIVILIDSLITGSPYLAVGVGLKELSRGVINFNEIASQCYQEFDGNSLCGLLTNDSGPGSIQAFFYTLGFYAAGRRGISNIEGRRDDHKTSILFAAAVSLIGILGGEVLPTFQGKAFNVEDIVTETVGATSALLVIAVINLVRKK